MQASYAAFVDRRLNSPSGQPGADRVASVGIMAYLQVLPPIPPPPPIEGLAPQRAMMAACSCLRSYLTASAAPGWL